jgi:hypothetical protein
VKNPARLTPGGVFCFAGSPLGLPLNDFVVSNRRSSDRLKNYLKQVLELKNQQLPSQQARG